MSRHERHETVVYIGPAALCPKFDDGRPYLLITGDQEDWALALIKERTKRDQTNKNFELRHNTIGKNGTTRKWHCFNHPSLNGVVEQESISWCNPNWNIIKLGTKKTENKKLEDILLESTIVEERFNLIIAQGDPNTTLKRSSKILKNCLSVDLSLHPLGMIWVKDIDSYLTKNGFIREEQSTLKWRNKTNKNSTQALASPSESEHFIHPTIQFILNSINIENFRKAIPEGNDVALLQRIALKNTGIKSKKSIKNIIQSRARESFRGILNGFRNDGKTKTTVEAKKLYYPDEHDGPIQISSLSVGNGYGETKKLRGHIDGLQGSFRLHGWVDASDFGDGPSTITVIWDEKKQVIGEGLADLERPDLAKSTINSDCGFEIELKGLKDLPLAQILDTPINLKVIESKSKQTINDQTWTLDIDNSKNCLEILFSEEKTNSRKEQILDYLRTTKSTRHLLIIRESIIKFSAIECMTNRWKELPIIDLIDTYQKNPSLEYGVDQESASRLEIVICALIRMISSVDIDNITNSAKSNERSGSDQPSKNLDTIASWIQERRFSGLQSWEKSLFDEYIRPLSDVLIATIFLQRKNRRFNPSETNLLSALASVFEETYNALQISFYLRSILKSQKEEFFDEEYTKLAHKRGDRFVYLLSHYTCQLEKNKDNNNLLYYTSAIDFATHCPALHRNIADNIKRTLPDHLKDHPRQSKPRHMVERLGWITSNSAQMLVSKMIDLGFSRNSIVNLHQEMIEIKRDLAELLWTQPNIKDFSSTQRSEEITYKKWLIVGEKRLTQCWMYRVEQKKAYLERLGCHVRCIDQQDLRNWSFSHDILWADAVIFCRLPAMYPYLRAITFAKSCQKKTYAEIDDLLFTPDYPADYEAYGGSIPLEQYKNLCIDYPLRLGMLEAVDEIIVSTQVLAETCKNTLSEKNKPIHVIPNLPLNELEKLSSLSNNDEALKKSNAKINIILTSGTLSHKQVLKDFIYPALIEVLDRYKDVELTTVGHIQLPSKFLKFKSRIHSAPFSSYSTYLSLLQKASIALVPLEVHPTTDAKSAIKWMEASLCGVASICSPVRAYTDVTKDQQDVLLASNLDEWRSSLKLLIEQPETRQSISRRAHKSALEKFNRAKGEQLWAKIINSGKPKNKQINKKVLVINVFFAPQSFGGATRVAQDYVQRMLADQDVNYDVTVLCTDYDCWQTDLDKKDNHEITDVEELGVLHKDTNSSLHGTTETELIDLKNTLKQQKISYRNSVSIDYANWRGAKIIRLNLPAKPWGIHQDDDIEAFCVEFFKNENFDLIQCHCCQVLTASPLIAAQKLGIPYEIIIHDAWWMSENQFLVSPAGRLINPSDPLGHFDKNPSEDEKADAISRRELLYDILNKAKRRVAVSQEFRKICESAGISDVEVQENKYTSMATRGQEQLKSSTRDNESIKLCHIGGMSLHKGYQLFRQAIHLIPSDLSFEITVVDHRLESEKDEYSSSWNSYKVKFIAPIAMDKMSQFYASQDVLVAPSIWPESFGLVTREALSAGLWVIASNAGALAEPLLSNESAKGTVVRPNHLDDLVKALVNCPNQLRQYV